MASPYLGCMLAHELRPEKIRYPVAVEDKLDGFRVTHVDGEGYTRNGNTYESLRGFASILRHTVGPGWHVDAEMVAPSWNETSKLLKRVKNVDHARIRELVTCHIFDVFDVLSLGKDPYMSRRAVVEHVARQASKLEAGRGASAYRFVASHMVICHNPTELDAAFAAALGRGREGIMVKTLDGVYTTKRSRAWEKLKPFQDITITITGAESGHGLCTDCMTVDKREERAVAINATLHVGGPEADRDDIKPDPNCPTCKGAATGIKRPDLLGALLGVTDTGAAVKVGMGFSDAMKLDFWARRAELVGKKADVKVQAEAGENEIVARHPVFMRWREDV